MGRSQRNKGKVGERKLAADLRAAFPHLADDIRRGWQTREGDDDPDVIFPGYWFESKFLKRYNTSPLDQATRDSKGRGIPVAVIRVNNKKPVVMFEWDEFLKMLKKIETVKPKREKRDGQSRDHVPARGGRAVLCGDAQRRPRESRTWVVVLAAPKRTVHRRS